MPNFNLHEEIPDTEEYRAMRVATGLSAKSAEAASRGLPNSLFSVCLRDTGGTLIGMGRIIGDGGLNFEIVDIAVHLVAYQHLAQGAGGGFFAAVQEILGPGTQFLVGLIRRGAAGRAR